MEQQTNFSNHQLENNWNSKHSKGNETEKLQKWKPSSLDMKKNKKTKNDPKIAIAAIRKETQDAETTAMTAKVITAATIAQKQDQPVVDVTQLR